MANSGSERLISLEVTNRCFAWSDPVHERLDGLLDILTEAGERSTKREIVAAMIAAASTDPDELTEMVRNYRLSTVDDIAIRD